MDINEIILGGEDDNDHPDSGSGQSGQMSVSTQENKGTLILDTTCAPPGTPASAGQGEGKEQEGKKAA